MSLHSFYSLLPFSSKPYNGKIFGRPVMKKDGSAGTRVVMPPIEELQRGYPGTDTRDQWIQYAVKDAEVTVADENFVITSIRLHYTAAVRMEQRRAELNSCTFLTFIHATHAIWR